MKAQGRTVLTWAPGGIKRAPGGIWPARGGVWLAPVLSCILLAGCLSTDQPAPVSTVKNTNKKPTLVNVHRPRLSGNSYKVKKGDTLYSIAFQARADYKKLASINNINSPYTIYQGQWLKLRSSRSKSKPQTTAKKSSTPTVVKKPTVSKKWRKPVAVEKKGEYSKTVPVKQRSSDRSNNGVAKKVSKWIWPSSGRVIATYSATEQGNKGIDIAGNRGDDVLASADGKVVYAGNALRGYGSLIIIKHSDDYLSAYAHNDKLFVTEKQWVKVGQRIAAMGSSGTTSNRLHYEIRFRGKSVDPLKYLPKRTR